MLLIARVVATAPLPVPEREFLAMRAIILAAGVGNRLQGAGHAGPKALLRFGGKSLLARHVALLRAAGVSDIVVATGFEAPTIEAALADLGGASTVRCVHNPEFRLGSVVTFWSLREEAQSGPDILLMDADVLYDGRMLEPLLATSHANCFLLDRNFEPGEEPMKLAVRDGRLVEYRRHLRVEPDTVGESVGFFRLSAEMAGRLAARCAALIDEGHADEGYETALGDLLDDSPEAFGYEDVTGLPWTEIDFPEDVVRAEREILPALQDGGTPPAA
jgi:choline kinase